MRIAVLGDVLLDHNIFVKAKKVASEGPVIAFEEQSEEYSLGGAGNVAAMCKALGAEVVLCGVVGKDGQGGRISDECIQRDIETKLIANGEHATTVKKRYFDIRDGQRHLVARFDRDCGYQCDANDARVFVKRIQEFKPDAVIIQDHGKGVVNRDLVKLVTQEQWATFIDPCRTTHPTMNSHVIVGGDSEICTDQNYRTMHDMVFKMGAGGVAFYPAMSDQMEFLIEAYCKRPVDTVGAGDQFISALVVERLLGESWKEACHVASIAAAIKSGRYGTKPVTYEEIHAYQIGTMW
jgi:bifunctional ADP-heptose synthase (sugar kinase/adenylyltransferase)